MSHPEESSIKLHMRNVTNNHQRNVVSFRSYENCDQDELQNSYAAVVGKIISGRDVIIVTKGAQLMNLISDEVDTTDQKYVEENCQKVSVFTLDSASFEITATLLRKVPLSVAKDLGTSSEFVFGNLWFLILSSTVDPSLRGEQVIDDSRKLAPSAFDEVPELWHEALMSPAMYDGLEMLWFKPDQNVYVNVIKPLFEN